MTGSHARQTRRADRRRQTAAAPRAYPRKRPGEHIGTQLAPGVTHSDPASLQDMCRITHDDLIAQIGDRRRSGVTWRFVAGSGPANSWLDDYAAATQQPLAAFAPYRDFLAEVDDGVLVIATCEVAL